MECFQSLYSYPYIFFVYISIYYWIVRYYTSTSTSTPLPSSSIPRKKTKLSPYYEKPSCIEYSHIIHMTPSTTKEMVYYKEFKPFSTHDPVSIHYSSPNHSTTDLYQLRCSGQLPFHIPYVQIHINENPLNVSLPVKEVDILLDLFSVREMPIHISFTWSSPLHEETSYIHPFTVSLYRVSNSNHYNSILLVRKKDTFVPSFYDTLLCM